jgi:trehalose synthase
MFHNVKTLPKKLRAYRGIIDDELYEEIIQLAKDLRSTRILHINSTATRGGIPEMLGNEVPLLNDIGLTTKWQVFDVPKDIYPITKYIHNGLQGSTKQLSRVEWQRYEAFNKELAKQIKIDGWDVIFVQDHQPTALLSFVEDKGKAKWLWRCHIDLTQPNLSYQKRYVNYLKDYDGAIFHAAEFVFVGYKPKHLLISPGAIDPLSPKNSPMSKTEARKILRTYGIDTKRPIITQLSRFDPWKDIPGAIKAWQKAKKIIPGVQLIIIGMTAPNDAQGQAILSEVSKLIKGQPDVFLFANNLSGSSTKAFLTASDIVLHKSLREGFSLIVTEALWASTPVIGGNVGGIRLQVVDGKNGYLVSSVEELAERIVTLLQDKRLADEMGKFGHEYIRQNFLLPRLMRDELRFMREILQG